MAPLLLSSEFPATDRSGMNALEIVAERLRPLVPPCEFWSLRVVHER
jgi:hypothetical protein